MEKSTCLQEYYVYIYIEGVMEFIFLFFIFFIARRDVMSSMNLNIKI